MIVRATAVTLLALSVVPAAPASAQDVVLTNATVIDGTGAAPVGDATITIRGGRIAAIGPSAGAGALPTIDLGGRYVLPGLIDAHCHLDSPEAARRALLSGVTTARVLGEGYWQATGTRDLIKGGHIEGPELLTAGPIIRPRPGVPFFVTLPEFGEWFGSELRGAANVARVVRAVLAKGVDVIKVGASERAGLASTDPRRPELTRDEIKAAVDEAARAGRFVAAHAHAEQGAEDAVRAGVRSIEHGTYLNERSLALMRDQGTFLVPTLAVMSPLGDPQGDSADDVALRIRTWHMQTALHAVVRRARALGVTVAASTDGSYGSGDDTARIRLQHDMEQLVACGYSPMEAIVAATHNGSRVLGIEQRTGTLAVGKEADLIVLDRSPLDDLRATFEPLLVVSNGRVVVNRLY